MQIRLSVKIMGAFVLLTLLTASLILVSVQYFSERNFQTYLRERENRIIANLIPKIEAVYDRTGSWEVFKTNPKRWQRFIRSGGRLPRRLRNQIKNENAPQKAAPILAPPAQEEPTGEVGISTGSQNGSNRWNRDELRETIDLMQLAGRLSLFDARQANISGTPAMTDIEAMHPLEVNGRTVGWVGVDASGALIYPVDRAFMQRQVQILIWVGAIILVVGCLLAYGFSRHLTAPLQHLAEASQKLGQRRFDTRIPVTNRDDELGRLAGAFNAMAANLDGYMRRQHQWLRDISHELRTPLAVLLGEIEAVQDGVRPVTPEAVASLHAEVSHLIAIVSDLHELARAEADGFTLDLKPVAPADILATVTDLFDHRLGESGITLVNDTRTVKECLVLGDGERIHQLFTNLIHNVLRHAEGADRLTIRGRRSGGWLELSFDDNGPGVPTDALPHLFDRLFRVDPSRSRSTGGSGIGLSVCQTIVAGHGGSISAANAPHPGHGLIMTVRIPLLPPTPAAAPFPLPLPRRKK